jgi:hypothetical protein
MSRELEFVSAVDETYAIDRGSLMGMSLFVAFLSRPVHLRRGNSIVSGALNTVPPTRALGYWF